MSGVLAKATVFGVSGFLGYYYASKLLDFYMWETDSMEPFIGLGEVVLVEKMSEEFQGNICTFVDAEKDKVDMGYVVADEGDWVVKKGKPMIKQVPKGHVFLEMVNMSEDYYPQFVPKSSLDGIVIQPKIEEEQLKRLKETVTHRRFEERFS